MSEKTKYQVFVSSTYTDLAQERRQILDVLLMADCIPSGMESFVAQDDEQFSVIKKVIDLCDYYILILGRRYGSVNVSTGISYTEMEYNYAIEKGIPVLVFALSEDAHIETPASEKEEDVIKKGKLAEFKEKAMNNRLASMWQDQGDLVGKVAVAIMKAKDEIPRPGWHRGEDEEKKRMLAEIEALKKDNERLKSKASLEDESVIEEKLNHYFYDVRVSLHYTEIVLVFAGDTSMDKVVEETTLDELFKHISVRLTGRHGVKVFIDAINSFKAGYSVDEQDAFVIKNKYEQLDLIHSSLDKHNNEVLELTELGRNIMNRLHGLPV